VTFQAFETSDELSRPVELYTITIGTDVFRYTSTEGSFTRGGNTFLPVPISRGELTYGPDERASPLEIMLPAAHEIPRRYIIIPPGLAAVVSVQRTQVDDPDQEIIDLFNGQIHAVRFDEDGERAVLTVFSIEHDLGAEMPRFGYQSLCNHVLYDSGCTVDENDPAFKFTGIVSAESGSTITVIAAGSHNPDPGFFVAGFVKPQGFTDFRMVIAQAGDLLTLLLPFPVPLLHSVVTINSGCDHLVHGHCAQRYNNVINHGGFGFVPVRNIFIGGLD